MRCLVVALALAGCYRGTTPTPAPAVVTVPQRSSPPASKPSLARLTPPEVLGVVLGMSRDGLLKARSDAKLDSERYEFRDHYVETLGRGGIDTVHYYTLPDGGALYQISFDYTEGNEALAEAMWHRYQPFGSRVEDLGGDEIVIEGYPFQIRVWFSDRRVQIMGVLEGSEWWSQYHAGGDAAEPDDD